MDHSLRFKLNKSFACIAAIILFISPLMRFSWDIGPQTLMHIALLALILSSLKKNQLVYASGLYVPCALLAGASLLSLSYNSNSSAVRANILVLFDSIVLACAAASTPEEDREIMIAVPVLAGLLLSITTLSMTLLIAVGAVQSGSGFSEVIVNYNVLAGYLLMTLPLSFIFWKRYGLAAQFISALMFAAILLSGSRTAALISLCILLVYSYIYFKGRPWRVIFVALIFSMFLACLFAAKSMFYSSFFDRIAWCRSALAMFIDRPFTGVGWGNFGDLYLAYRQSPGLNSSYTHNIILQFAAETGILGLLAFSFLVINFFKSALIRQDENGGYITALTLSVSGFLLFNLFDYGFFVPALMYLFFFMLGLVFNAKEKLALPYKTPSALYYGAFALGVFLIAQPFMSSLFLGRSVYYFNLKDFDKSQSYALRSLEYDGSNWQAYTRLAEIHFTKYNLGRSAAELDDAIQMQRNALKYFPQSARLNSDIAWLCFESRQYDKSLEYMKKAVYYDKFNPRYGDSLNNLEGKLLNARQK